MNIKTVVIAISLLFECFILSAQGVNSISLNGEWKLYYGEYSGKIPSVPEELQNSNWPEIPANVPGNVELDLLASGIIKNPEIGANIYDLRKYEGYQWWYYREFETPGFAEGDLVEIVFEGLDCFGTIWINNQLVGKTENMLIDHRFDVTNLLKPGETNSIHVRIDPTVREAQKNIVGTVGRRSAHRTEFQRIRKAPSMFGWDIMPRLISAGLWRGVHLDIKKPTRIEQVYWMTNKVDVPQKKAELMLDWQISTDYPTVDNLNIEMTLERGGKTVYKHSRPIFMYAKREQFGMDNVDFWWPRGYGDPALYDATFRLIGKNGKVLDENKQRIGIRTVKLVRSEVATPENPGEFVFVVNGEKIFIKGTNWVPLDALHSRDKSHVKGALDMAVDLNCNMIRCWGGNVYEDHPFFDICDENGIMVWQDFAFAGTPYAQDPDFLEQIRKEAINIVLKLRRHPSLALWCGNNEIDYYFVKNFDKAIDPREDKISRDIIPHAIWEYDPLRDYLPSSPYVSEECFKYQQNGYNHGAMPQVHLWGPRGYYKASFYTDVNSTFVSEIGYHGCPNRASLEKMFDREYVYPWIGDYKWNDEWLAKAVRIRPDTTDRYGRNTLMVNQVNALFGECPKDLDQFISASQTVQAEAMKYFVEFWRMDKFRRSGIIWWNLRDGWPIISDAITDYYNSKKLAYYYIRQVQHNTCVMVGDSKDGEHPVVAVNDTREAKSGVVTVRDADSGKMLFSGSFEIPANGKTIVGNIPEKADQAMWLIDYTVGDKKYSNHYLAGKAPFRLKDYQRWYKKLNIVRQ